jgi:ZIP family zinc transporter
LHSDQAKAQYKEGVIEISNIPEGLAVGVSFGMASPTTGILLAMAIGLQNMPEGLAVALPLIREGYRQRRAVAYATLSGLVEPVAGLIGVVAVTAISALLPYGLCRRGHVLRGV